MRNVTISQRRHPFGSLVCTVLLPLTWETRWLDMLRVRLRIGICNCQLFHNAKLILPLLSVSTVGLSSARTSGLEACITHLLLTMTKRCDQSWPVHKFRLSSFLVATPAPPQPSHILVLSQVLLGSRDLSERGLYMSVISFYYLTLARQPNSLYVPILGRYHITSLSYLRSASSPASAGVQILHKCWHTLPGD